MAAYRPVYDSVTCRLTAKNWDQLRNPTLGNRVWATFFTSTFLTIVHFIAEVWLMLVVKQIKVLLQVGLEVVYTVIIIIILIYHSTTEHKIQKLHSAK